MKKMKLFVFLFLSFLSMESFSQIGVTSYSIYSVGVNTSQNKLICGELKIFANKPLEDVSFEVDAFYNFKPGEYHRFSVGLGVNINTISSYDPFYALTIPVALQIYPLQDFKRLSLLFELTPELVTSANANLRSLWGIRYTFGE